MVYTDRKRDSQVCGKAELIIVLVLMRASWAFEPATDVDWKTLIVYDLRAEVPPLAD